MRQPLRMKGQTKRQQVSQSQSYPAPLGGWNARDALAAMKPTDAVALENWFPKTSYLEIRGGFDDHVTGISGSPSTLAVYNALSGMNKMFAAITTAVYDVSSAGAVGASVATITNGKFQWDNFGDGTNNYLIMVNGVDKPLYYNGSTWTEVDGVSSPALTGLTTTNIINLCVFKGRLIFIEKASLSFWYLAAGAAGGALTEYPLDSVAKRGGYLMAAGTWTLDGGSGLDDYAVFVTSEGEIIIYKGTDPSSANTWALVGVFHLGKPLGRRCLIKYGGDLVLITQNGAFPMSTSLQSQDEARKTALTNKIEQAFNDAARSYGSNFGWEATLYPAQSAILFNIPISEGGEHEQYVMNTITKAWCKFKEWDAETFCVYNGDLYFATSTKVVKAWSGAADGTSDVVAYAKQAFSYFNSPGVLKQFKLFRPMLNVNGSISFLSDIDVDYKDNAMTGTATYSVVAGAVWDDSYWDVDYWAAGLAIVKNWTTPSENVGYCAAGKIKVTTGSLTVQWMSSDYVYETGGIV